MSKTKSMKNKFRVLISNVHEIELGMRIMWATYHHYG